MAPVEGAHLSRSYFKKLKQVFGGNEEGNTVMSGEENTTEEVQASGEGADGEQPAASEDAKGQEGAEEAVPSEETAEQPAEVTLSREELSALQEKIQSLTNEVGDNREKYLRALADYDNFRKRAQKERSELLRYQGEKVFHDILEIVDNLELAIAHEKSDPAKLREGLELIHKRFVDILGKWEVRGESSKGKEFDPNVHNAISKIKVDDAKPGTIIGELKKPYFYKDKLLRVGEVVVAEGEAEPAEEADLSLDGPAEETSKD